MWSLPLRAAGERAAPGRPQLRSAGQDRARKHSVVPFIRAPQVGRIRHCPRPIYPHGFGVCSVHKLLAEAAEEAVPSKQRDACPARQEGRGDSYRGPNSRGAARPLSQHPRLAFPSASSTLGAGRRPPSLASCFCLNRNPSQLLRTFPAVPSNSSLGWRGVSGHEESWVSRRGVCGAALCNAPNPGQTE